MLKRILRGTTLALALATVLTGPVLAGEKDEARLRDLVHSKILPLIAESIVVDSVKTQNRAHASLTDRQIARLDKIWRDEIKRNGGPLIDEVMAGSLSRYLREVKKAHGDLFTDIYVMDAKGLNVGQTNVTPDYWQGDEGKWRKTFLAGRGAIRISKVKMDDTSGKRRARVTLSIVDPETNEVIGAVTVGVNVDELG